MKPSCYTASQMKHRGKWLSLRRDEQVEWTAHWPDIDVEDTPDNSAWFWRIDHNNVAISDFVLVYAEEGDVLRGALIEAGIAIGMGKTVIVVGSHFCYGTWQYHPAVIRTPTLDSAIELMILLRKEEHEGAPPR